MIFGEFVYIGLSRPRLLTGVGGARDVCVFGHVRIIHGFVPSQLVKCEAGTRLPKTRDVIFHVPPFSLQVSCCCWCDRLH